MVKMLYGRRIGRGLDHNVYRLCLSEIYEIGRPLFDVVRVGSQSFTGGF
jgi:hypothetical protein